MKTIFYIKVTVGLCLLTIGSISAATFDSGSNGSYGAINITAHTTLDMPPDGVFHCTTITVASGTLSFNRNALNTPVYLLATGDVVIQVSGVFGNPSIVSVTGGSSDTRFPGKGGPGGFDGGSGAFQDAGDGDGQGPGAGKLGTTGNAGVFAFPAGDNANIYGNTLIQPLIGGSGGAAGYKSGEGRYIGGGGGGGAILIASSTRVTINGAIQAGGGGGYGGGSGGAIRVVAPVIDGTGRLDVTGGSSYRGPAATDGRTRLDTLDRFAHRGLTLGGKGTRGSQMVVFPPGDPRLDIVEVAGQSIPEASPNSVSITLPVGSSQNQTVKVQARNFTGDVPITVSVAPENGASARFDGVISNTGSPSIGTVNVVIPIDGVNHIFVWTR